MLKLDTAFEKYRSNFAQALSEEELTNLGEDVVEQFELDKATRTEWESTLSTWLKLASQIHEAKNYPWPKAANMKYPLLTTAALQFNARANQSLINNTRPVFGKVIGEDEDGKKNARAERVSKHMSYQVLEEIPNWEENNDRLFMILPIAGVMYKKIYQTSAGIRSDLILPHNLVINYKAKDFEKARKSYIYRLSSNEIITEVRSGAFLDVDLGDSYIESDVLHDDVREAADKISGTTPSATGADNSQGYTIVEQHYEWDLDGDGYAEPYLIKIELLTRKVLQILPRFELEEVQYNENQEIVKIEPEEFFVRYPFVPDLASPVYSQGFGSLLGPLNEGINSSINMMLDAGKLATVQGGFLGRGVRLPQGGQIKFEPGKWKILPNSGDDIRKAIFPLPAKEPSGALFNLLQLLISAGTETASVADIMKGENPGQNQPHSTTMTVLEQGLQVFTSIYKRLFRAYSKEYKRIFMLNAKYLPQEQYFKVLDLDEAKIQEVSISNGDYNPEGVNVLPAADPDIVSETQKMVKAESLGMKLQMGLPLNPQTVTHRMLVAEGHEDIQELLTLPPPQPNPELEFEIEQHRDKTELEWAKIILEASRHEVETVKDISQAMANIARAENMEQEAIARQEELMLELVKHGKDTRLKLQELQDKRIIEAVKLRQEAQKPKNGNTQ